MKRTNVIKPSTTGIEVWNWLTEGLKRAKELEVERTTLIHRIQNFSRNYDADWAGVSYRDGRKMYRRWLELYHVNISRAIRLSVDCN